MPALWISDDGLYLARDIPGESTWRDVIEISTGKVWLGARNKPKSFQDLRCGLPEFRAQVMGWSNCGRYNATRGPHRYERWIEAWSLGFGDIDIEHAKANRYYARYIGARREATFRRKVPVHHTRRHAWAAERVSAALAADPSWSAVGLAHQTPV